MDSVVLQVASLTSSSALGVIGKPNSSLTSAAAYVFDVKALINNTTELDSFDLPVRLTLTYTDADMSGLDESSLAMYHYSDSAWSELDDCTANTTANTITCETDSFSIFGIFGTGTSGSGSTSGSGGGIRYGCKDKSALNYEYFSSHRQDLCRYTEVQTGLCPRYQFTRRLQFGSEGEDVRALQKFLNCAGFTIAYEGLGAPGNETLYFADRTLAAVKLFQTAYATEILLPGGFLSPTGIFATFSQAKAYSLMQP